MKNIWKYIFVFYILLLVLISVSAYLRIIPTEISQFPHYDTVMHFVLLGFAAYSAHRAIKRKYVFRMIPLGPFIILVLAILEECSQIFSDARCFSLTDLLANISGIIVFYVFDLFTGKKDFLNKGKTPY